ncbi:MAG: hypothetical protein ACREIW_14985 [Chthoniobacterales bacterium]
MKRLSILFVIGWALLAFGCADPLEQRKSSEVQQQWERGLGGGGKIGPIQRAPDDPAGEHAVPQDHP